MYVYTLTNQATKFERLKWPMIEPQGEVWKEERDRTEWRDTFEISGNKDPENRGEVERTSKWEPVSGVHNVDIFGLMRRGGGCYCSEVIKMWFIPII